MSAQTSYYFYNHNNERVYLMLDTQHAFLSVKEAELPVGIQQRSINTAKFLSDKADQRQYQAKKGKRRYYTKLEFEEKMSDEQYLKLLSDMKRQNKEAMISPYFKMENETIGLSNFFYVTLKSESDTTLLRKISEQTKSIIVEQIQFLP